MRRSSRSRACALSISLALSLALTACEAGQFPLDPPPLSEPDAGSADAAAPPPPDSGAPRDAGFALDAMTPPPPPDAGVAPDAAVEDAGFPTASERIYVNTMDALFSFDPMTAAMTEVGMFHPFAGDGMTDIAIDLDGYLYGGSFAGDIYRINPQTAAVQRLFNINVHPTGLTFLADGRLVVAGERVMIVDRYTGTILETLTTEFDPETSGDIVGLQNGSLYASVVTPAPAIDDLIRIDPVTHVVTRVGSLGTGEVYGLGVANNKLWGFCGDGSVIEIDANTAMSMRRQSFARALFGATTNPVLW